MNILPNNQFAVNVICRNYMPPTKIFNYKDIKDIAVNSNTPALPTNYIELHRKTSPDPFFGAAIFYEISQEDAISLINLFHHLDSCASTISNTIRYP